MRDIDIDPPRKHPSLSITQGVVPQTDHQTREARAFGDKWEKRVYSGLSLHPAAIPIKPSSLGPATIHYLLCLNLAQCHAIYFEISWITHYYA